MATKHSESLTLREFQGLVPAHIQGGSDDDGDARDDEHAGENEASVRAVDEGTEIPEEFAGDYEREFENPEGQPSPALRLALRRLRRDPRSLLSLSLQRKNSKA